MARLYYQNLDVHRPDVTMKQTFYGLRTFYEFLRRTIDYMESDAAVLRLAWKPVGQSDKKNGDGIWVQLEEPVDRPNEPDSTFNAFLDESVNEVYEAIVPIKNEQRQIPKGKRGQFTPQNKIRVVEQDSKNNQLLLDTLPSGKELLLRPNTYVLNRQMRALQTLQDKPRREHKPLLRLLESQDHAKWPAFEPSQINDEDWMVLTDKTRDGAEEQRRFVGLGLATSDFALLEGPPGSGKTTAICELILQLAKQGKRALLCASTHVAVDNVIERLMDERNPNKDLVVPVRIGKKYSVSEKAAPWLLERFTETERRRLLEKLSALEVRSVSQQFLYSSIQHRSSLIERMVLDAANLVCGTTVGMLQHPDIKEKEYGVPVFDVLIIDEASKTTFQEFLVPAMLAKRWIIVGDPKQLSPYVEDAAMATNVRACLKDEAARNACVDVFIADQKHPKRRRTVAVATDNKDTCKYYVAQAHHHNVPLVDVGVDDQLSHASIVIGTAQDIESRVNEIPLDVATVRDSESRLEMIRRRADAWLIQTKRAGEEIPEWEKEISWRLITLYALRQSEGVGAGSSGEANTTQKRLSNELERLLPAIDRDQVKEEIDRVRRVALPSVLEVLRYGFERDPKARQGSALSDGIPDFALKRRHVLLSTQHRMHPAIAEFSHQHIYGGKALFTPARMEQERQWSFRRYRHPAIWLDVYGGFNGRLNRNTLEAEVVVAEITMFSEWAKANPTPDGRPWDVAVLTFYRGQEKEIRQHLRKWTAQHHAVRHFNTGSKASPDLSIELCTVDRFQGHEADLVFISLANDKPTSFLQSPNRLNVALTRARFQRVIVGNRKAMCRARRSVLGQLAESEPWDKAMGG